MSTLSLRRADRYDPSDTASDVLPSRWSPLFATLVWSTVSALVWTAVVGAGLAFA